MLKSQFPSKRKEMLNDNRNNFIIKMLNKLIESILKYKLNYITKTTHTSKY